MPRRPHFRGPELYLGRFAGGNGIGVPATDTAALSRVPADPFCLTGVEIKDRLATTSKVAAALIRCGHLRTVTVINPVNRCPILVVPVEEVDRFAAEYVSLFALARQQGRHHMAVKKELDAAGVKPAMDPDEVGATSYRRAESTGK